MATDKILSRKEGPIGHLIFNNPERRNAVSLDMWEAAAQVLDRFAEDDELRVVIVSGAGGKAFVSGADISKFETERGTPEAVARYNAMVAQAYLKFQEFPKPTIARIDGYCVGGGVGLAVSCDLRICGESSRFAIPAAKLGLGYGFDGIRSLVNVVGPAFAMEILYTARLFDAEEARIMGLVNRVVPDAELAAHVDDYAGRISQNAPLTIKAVKGVVGEILKDPADRDLKGCEALVRACFASADYAEGRRAFMEKRKPAFIGA